MFQVLAGRAAVPEVTYPDVLWDSNFLPPEYVLSQGGKAYARSGVNAGNTDLSNFVFTDKVMALKDLGGGYGHYWEIDLSGSAVFGGYHGVMDVFAAEGAFDQGTDMLADAASYRGDGGVWQDGTQTANLTNYGDGDTLMMAFDPLDGALWTGVNGTWDREPWRDEPGALAPGAGPMGLFTVAGQARGPADAGVLKASPLELTYPIPEGFISLSETDPNPIRRPPYWEFAGDSGLDHSVPYARSPTFRSSTSFTTRYMLGSRVIGGSNSAGVPTAGYYWELRVTGFLGTDEDVSAGLLPSTQWGQMAAPRTLQYRSDGRFYFNGSSALGLIDTWDRFDRLMFCYNPHTGSIWLGKNGVWMDDPDVDPPTYQYSIGLTIEWKVCVQHAAPSIPGEDKGATIYALPDSFQYDMPANAIPLGQWP